MILSLFLALSFQSSAVGYANSSWNFDESIDGDNPIMHFSTILEIPYTESSQVVFWPGLYSNPKDIRLEGSLVQSLVHNDFQGKE